ncbi:MAG TPA: ribosome maturation factor RimM [Oligoflexia bacterium]|nr:ribosome maturation factor RimM [Oligoflexia bacterium]
MKSLTDSQFLSVSLTEEYITLGKVGKAKGLQGHFFVELYYEASEFFSYADCVYIGDHLQPYSILSVKFEKDRWLLALEGINNRNLAQALVNQTIYYPRKDLPETSNDEVYVHDLIGLNVVDQDDNILGRVQGLIESKAHEILSIIDSETNKEWLCPFHEQYIEAVDLDKKVICLKNWEELRAI